MERERGEKRGKRRKVRLKEGVKRGNEGKSQVLDGKD